MRTAAPRPRRRTRHPLVAALAAACAVTALAAPAAAHAANDSTQFSVIGGALAFGAAPNVPNLPAVTLNGQAQTVTEQMAGFSVDDSSGTAAGWNITVAGDDGSGKSPVFKQYDTGSSTYGSTALAQNSLTLTSTGASFSPVGGTSGTAPTHQCGSGCFLDTAPASPVKVASAGANAGMGTWQTAGYSTSSLSLAVPSTIQALGAGEVYRLDLAWTLNSGP